MHWFFAKKKTSIPVSAPRPHVHKPRTRYNRISVPRPAPKTKSKSIARPRPRPLTRKVRPSASFNSLRTQLNEMKRATNKMRQNADNRAMMENFRKKGIPEAEPEQGLGLEFRLNNTCYLL